MLVSLGIVARFGLGGRDISDRFEQATIVEPVDPFEGGEFDCLGTALRGTSVDYLRLEQAVDGFSERVVVTVADAADGRLDPGLRQTLADLVLPRPGGHLNAVGRVSSSS